MRRSIYAEHYIKRSHRAKFTPRVDRPWRPRMIAWAGPAAFMRDRWYERDAWYKARIQKPEVVPRLHIIDPDRFVKSFAECTKVERHYDIDIGFKKPSPVVKEAPNNEALEKLARKGELEIDLLTLNFDQLSIYSHYNMFDDLFMPGVYFNNTQAFSVHYGESSVERGNLLKAGVAAATPSLKIGSVGSDAYNTVVMVNLDGDAFTESKDTDCDQSQLLQWVVGNIPDGSSEGETVVPYLPPTPYKGTGYHRVAFLLFRHKDKLDLSSLKLKGDHLSDRVFRMNRFFKSHEQLITPTALNFAQFKWDESVDKTLHDLGMKSPRFHYEWNTPLKPEQEEYPKKPMPFNLYLDMYRPPAVVQRDMFKKKLEKIVHEGSCEPAPYPDMFYVENRKRLPRWQHAELMKENTGTGKYASLYLKNGFVNAVEQAELESEKRESAV